jgi:hypothetical protein
MEPRMRALTLPDARRSLGRLSLAKERGGEGRIMATDRAFGLNPHLNLHPSAGGEAANARAADKR